MARQRFLFERAMSTTVTSRVTWASMRALSSMAEKRPCQCSRSGPSTHMQHVGKWLRVEVEGGAGHVVGHLKAAPRNLPRQDEACTRWN